MCGLKKIISMFILLTLSITQVSAVNIPIERLNVSKDYASVQTAGTDICNLVNTLTESSTLHSNNINWDNVYKIYVDDNDIFTLSSYSKNDIINSLDYIWSYMDNVNNHNIRVTISRAQMPEHELVDNGVINETTYNELAKKLAHGQLQKQRLIPRKLSQTFGVIYKKRVSVTLLILSWSEVPPK